MGSVSDAELSLINRILSGHKEEYRLVVNEHLPLIFAMIQRQVGDPLVAEDLTQETFVKAYLNLKSFKGESKLSTWLVRIALNQTSSYFSSRPYTEKLRSQSFDVGQHDALVDSSAVQQKYETEKAATALRRAVSQLKPKFREVITLCAFEGKSYEEAAELLAIPIGTVRSRLNSARLQLKDLVTGGL